MMKISPKKTRLRGREYPPIDGKCLCTHTVNLLVIKSLYSILLMPFFDLTMCRQHIFQSTSLCLSSPSRAKQQNTRCVSWGPFSWLFCISSYRHVLYIKQVFYSVCLWMSCDLRIARRSLISLRRSIFKPATKRMAKTRFCILMKFILCKKEGSDGGMWH